MTKKQMAAINAMITREVAQLEELKSTIKPGLHAARDGWLVTDGASAVVFSEKPDGIPEADPLDSVYYIVQNDINNSDHVLACIATADKVKEWKALVKPWKQGKNQKTGAVPVELSAQKEDGSCVSGYFNPCHLVNIVEVVGPGAMLYIGRRGKFSRCSFLLVYPKDWMENGRSIVGYLLPLCME